MLRGKSDRDLLDELLKKGYGEEERKRRRLQTIRRSAPSSGPVTVAPAGPSPFATPQDEDTTERRIEDRLPDLPPRLRRRIDRYARRNNYKCTGLIERLRGLLTIVNRRLPDPVNGELLKDMVGHTGKRAPEDPRSFNLLETVRSLETESRFLLGRDRLGSIRRLGQERIEQRVLESLRMQEPFLLDLLRALAQRDEMAVRSLEYTRLNYAQGQPVEARKLARVVFHVFRVALVTARLSPALVDRLLDRAADVNRAHELDAVGRRKVTVAAETLRGCMDNIQDYRHQLFPILLKCMARYFREDELWLAPHYGEVLEFLELPETAILDYEARTTGFPPQREEEPAEEEDGRPQAEEEQDGEEETADQQTSGVEDDDGEAEEEKKAEAREEGSEGLATALPERFYPILTLLARIFPGSGIHRIHRYHYILPYFDLQVFNKDLTFPETAQQMGRSDPMSQIMVLHRIIDNLLSSIDTVSLDEVLGRSSGHGQRLAEMFRRWQRVYADLFDPYLKTLAEFNKLTQVPGMRHGPAARRCEESLNRIRNHVIRNFGRVFTGPAGIQINSPPLYLLSEHLAETCAELSRSLSRSVAPGPDPHSVRMLQALADRRTFDLEANSYKPTIERLRRFVDKASRAPLPNPEVKVPMLFLEVLYGAAELYDWLLSDPASPYHRPPGGSETAGPEERKRWSSMRAAVRTAAASGQGPVEHHPDAGSWAEAFGRAFAAAKTAGRPPAITLVRIDGREELEREGDQSLEEITARFLSSGRRFRVFAVGRYLLVITGEGESLTATQAEHWRKGHVEALERHPLYGEIMDARSDTETRWGTLSIGVAGARDCESAMVAYRRAEAALQAAMESGNRVMVNHRGTVLPLEEYVSRYATV